MSLEAFPMSQAIDNVYIYILQQSLLSRAIHRDRKRDAIKILRDCKLRLI